MAIRTEYKPGDWLIYCDRCGFPYYHSETKKEWNNLVVCKSCWEPKHPQYNEPHGLGEKQSVPVHRPQQPIVYGRGSADDL